MKTALAAIALLVAAVVLYLKIPTLHLHMLHPWPVYALLAAALAAALKSDARRALKLPVVALSALVGILFVGYHESYSRIEMPEMAVQIGDPFPDFALPTSQGATFSSGSLRGQSRALYIFYRGDW
jgi:hypothetical protein